MIHAVEACSEHTLRVAPTMIELLCCLLGLLPCIHVLACLVQPLRSCKHMIWCVSLEISAFSNSALFDCEGLIVQCHLQQVDLDYC